MDQHDLETFPLPTLGRRDFLRAGGLTAAMVLANPAKVMAGPFSASDFDKIIPADKKLSKDWIAGLYARGKALSATGDELSKIGMPINGLCTGQVYLAGDGRLWYWNLDGTKDRKINNPKGPTYMKPLVAGTPEIQGFALKAGGKEFALDATGFKDVTFTNQYPMATVDYADAACPVAVQLQAYTPFIPLNRDDSSFPVVIMRYTITNTSSATQEVAIAGWIESIAKIKSRKAARGKRLCEYRELNALTSVECSAQVGASGAKADKEVYADFEGESYGDWTIEGAAFGSMPSTGADAEGVQKLSGMRGRGLANTWNGSDELKGTLNSPKFEIEKPYINFLIGGGKDKNLSASLWVNGEVVRSVSGTNSDAMVWESWNVKPLIGKKAQFVITDASSAGWGHIEVDHIEFSTQPPDSGSSDTLAGETELGSIALGLLDAARPEIADIARRESGASNLFDTGRLQHGAVNESPMSERAFASLGKEFVLKSGESKTISFAISWHFPRVQYATAFGMRQNIGHNHYATQWANATEVAGAIASRETELYGTTQQWVDTWYDSTLPHWFLERTFLTLDCVQTQMGQRLAKTDEKPEFYNFDEGVKCCHGNCTHVWHYAQGLARIFPDIERECRDKVEFGLGLDSKTGEIHHRWIGGEKYGDAIDGNCGTILRVLRESQMTTDYSFLESIWDRVQLAMDHVIKKWDADEDGLLAGDQHNTLDQPWYGQVHWHINLYHAALKASAVMARQMNQPAVAARYEKIVEKGAPAMVDLLWREDFGYFIHKPGEGEMEKHGSTNGCHIDQILGDSWLLNVGIDPVLPKDKIKKSLQSLWKYNFTPDVGAFRKVLTGGRWYAGPGDAGLVMCSFPNGKVLPKSGKEGFNDYLNECMTGFEWQVAAHMIWEGMIEEGLAIGKAIYDRYTPDKRNPYNEIECSDHYSRAMASYGAFTAACGYRYDGPEGKLAFGPRLSPEDFRAGFTTAVGWGSFSQKVVEGQQSERIELRYGSLGLNELAFDTVPGTRANSVLMTVNDQPVQAKFKAEAGRYLVRFETLFNLKAGDALDLKFMTA